MKYDFYIDKSITKEVLDSINVGDYVRCNYWKRAMKVRYVTENYFVCAVKAFGKGWIYSVCEKKPFGGIGYNDLIGGYFSIGTDNMVFGYQHDHAYEFDNEDFLKDYMSDFEDGTLKLSMRRSTALREIWIGKQKAVVA